MSKDVFFSEPTWAIVELMGHNITAGQISEVSVAGTQMLRVDVPATDYADSFTQFYGGGAIYRITPTDEESARHAVAHISKRPIDKWTIPDKSMIEARSGDDEISF